MSASGDDGTGKQGFLHCKSFDATWPASSPFVTAVGATYLDEASDTEVGWADSGGGFSAIFGPSVLLLARFDSPHFPVFLYFWSVLSSC